MIPSKLTIAVLAVVDTFSCATALSSGFGWVCGISLIGDSPNISFSSIKRDNSLETSNSSSKSGIAPAPRSLLGRLPDLRLEAMDLDEDSWWILMRFTRSSSSSTSNLSMANFFSLALMVASSAAALATVLPEA